MEASGRRLMIICYYTDLSLAIIDSLNALNIIALINLVILRLPNNWNELLKFPVLSAAWSLSSSV